jgi:hypothetical protein
MNVAAAPAAAPPPPVVSPVEPRSHPGALPSASQCQQAACRSALLGPCGGPGWFEPCITKPEYRLHLQEAGEKPLRKACTVLHNTSEMAGGQRPEN